MSPECSTFKLPKSVVLSKIVSSLPPMQKVSTGRWHKDPSPNSYCLETEAWGNIASHLCWGHPKDASVKTHLDGVLQMLRPCLAYGATAGRLLFYGNHSTWRNSWVPWAWTMQRNGNLKGPCGSGLGWLTVTVLVTFIYCLLPVMKPLLDRREEANCLREKGPSINCHVKVHIALKLLEQVYPAAGSVEPQNPCLYIMTLLRWNFPLPWRLKWGNI